MFITNRNIKRSVYCQYGYNSLTFRALALRQREGPMLETLDNSIRIGRPFYISICISTLPTQHTTHVYYSSKLGQNLNTTLCRLCQTKPETVLHLLSGCPRLSQTEYLYRHNNVLKCLYFALLLNNLASLKQFHFQTVASNQSPQRRRTT